MSYGQSKKHVFSEVPVPVQLAVNIFIHAQALCSCECCKIIIINIIIQII